MNKGTKSMLLSMFLNGQIGDAELETAVNKGWITMEDKAMMMEYKNDTSTK